ncbi:autotransporter outer membrane beta-barrel domain-containing protein [Thalassovita mediterranea]|jgi:hypothetical protein|uniref:Autotransporter domain-containing protein n=2 Tax=Thalassovita mediterranea TaxID=340021 RepID=A0A0P1GMZ6_9RHOB|nr:autotransporter outer membrane beta-barrel domain-containing protein [Thalassovita mediterranea]MCG7574133.1 autotransporter outer membrane beta-barrel domain-containing protein [Phaeobacter sp. CNT1-3]CUH83856.1 hypothetical protein TM5383_01059 [Thalassovita mediterranea]SIS28272.1 hypothetical protein SAMN05421685_101455 [Thalassovita mediterranea]
MIKKAFGILAPVASLLAYSASPVAADSFRTCEGFSETYSSRTSEVFTLSLQAGDRLLVNFGPESSFDAVSIRSKGTELFCSGSNCDEYEFVVPEDVIASILVQLDPSSIGGSMNVSCRPSAGGTADSGAAAAAGSASGTAIRQGLAGAQSGRSSSGGSSQVTQNSLHFTGKSDAGTYVWTQLKGTDFSGSLDGNGFELTAGVDWQIGQDKFAGVLVSYGDYDITSDGNNFDNTAWSVGPYLSARFDNNKELDAYLTFARPEYANGGSSYRSDRVLGSVTLRGDIVLGNTLFEGYAGLDAYSEKLPDAAPGGARTVTSQTARIGARFDFNRTGNARPFVRIGADATRFRDGGTRLNSVAPSLGLGIVGDFANGGYHLTLDGGEIFDGARATTVSFGFNRNF